MKCKKGKILQSIFKDIAVMTLIIKNHQLETSDKPHIKSYNIPKHS